MERWKARLNVAADAAEPEQAAGEEPEPAVAELAAAEQQGEEEAGGGEYRFLGQQEQQQAGDAQALAPATEEQAAAQQQQQGQEEEHGGGGDADVAAAADEEEGQAGEEAKGADQPPPGKQQQLVSGTANWGAGGDRKAGLEAADAEQQAAEPQPAEAGEEEGQDGGISQEEEAEAAAGAEESYVAARLQAASLEDGLPLAEQAALGGLSEEAAAALRQQLDARLRAASEGSAPLPDAAAAAHGREVWARCEALTAGGLGGQQRGGSYCDCTPACGLQRRGLATWPAVFAVRRALTPAALPSLPTRPPGLVGELAEQLRLILEPTLASRLAGDYRSGKRINMKKVGGQGQGWRGGKRKAAGVCMGGPLRFPSWEPLRTAPCPLPRRVPAERFRVPAALHPAAGTSWWPQTSW